MIMDFLLQLGGEAFAYNYLIKFFNSLEILCCIWFFTTGYHRKRHLLLRMLGGEALMLALLVPLCLLRAAVPGYWTSCLVTFSIYGYYLGLLFFCYSEPLSLLLLSLCSGLATQTIIGRLYEFLYLLLGKDPYTSLSLFPEGVLPPWLDWVIYCTLHFALIVLFSRLYRRKDVSSGSKRYTHLSAEISVCVIVMLNLLCTYSRPLEPEHPQLAMIIRIFAILYALAVLYLHTGTLEQGRMAEELRTTEELLTLEKKQFASIQDDMELINLKCHDIRHQLNQYAGKLTDSELQELKQAIAIYDSAIKTGSDILDMVLYKKQSCLEQRSIHLSCMADGSCLTFVAPSDLYSLLNNALENAIEAVEQIDDTQKRIISLNVLRENGFAAIHMANYFRPGVAMKDGVPQTTHQSDRFLHGYGTKSMRYIAEKYHGSIRFSTEDDIFFVDVLLPIPEEVEL